MKKHLPVIVFCLILYQTVFSDSGKIMADTISSDTLSWSWEVSSTVSTFTKTCTLAFSDSLLVDWGDGVREWIPDSLSAKILTHVYTTQANFLCSAFGAGITYFKADSRRVLTLDTHTASNLTYLSCTSNQISTLNLTNNPEIESLYCGSNDLTALNLSNNIKLQTLTCSDNKLTSVDVSALTAMKKITCHTNSLTEIKICPTGNLSYLSCLNCSLSVEALDAIFNALPTLPTAPTSKNLYLLNNPGSDNCHLEVAVAKNWLSDKTITKSVFFIPPVSFRSGDSVRVDIYLSNPVPAMAFELDLVLPEGFMLDTLRSCLTSARKGSHTLSVAKTSDTALQYKFLGFSMVNKDIFPGNSGSVLQLYLKVPAVESTYTIDIANALLVDTLTNLLDLSITDGTLTVTSAQLIGDANGDEQVDVTDIVYLVAWINGRNPAGFNAAESDIDGNGVWNIVDITKMVVIINARNIGSQASPESRFQTTTVESLCLYDASFAPPGNHLYFRQSEKDSTCLELCLDNKDAVQAIQVDVVLPDGFGFCKEQPTQKTDRNGAHLFSWSKISDTDNRFRLLSYALKPDQAFSGNSGVIARLSLDLKEGFSPGTYPVFMEQSILTGMDMVAVNSLTYDTRLTVSVPAEALVPIAVGSAAFENLWVRGSALREVSIRDISGRLLFEKDLRGLDYFSTQLASGIYLVRVCSDAFPNCVRKVVVQ